MSELAILASVNNCTYHVGLESVCYTLETVAKIIVRGIIQIIERAIIILIRCTERRRSRAGGITYLAAQDRRHFRHPASVPVHRGHFHGGRVL